MPEGADGLLGVVADHERDIAVQSHRHVQLVLEDVQRVEPVGLGPVAGARAAGRLEGHLRRVLRDAVDVGGAVEVEIHADGGWAERLAVVVGLEVLRPAAVAVLVAGGGRGRRRVCRVCRSLVGACRAVLVDGAAVLVVVDDLLAALLLLGLARRHGLDDLALAVPVLEVEQAAAVGADGQLAADVLLELERLVRDDQHRVGALPAIRDDHAAARSGRARRRLGVARLQHPVRRLRQRLDDIRHLPARVLRLRDPRARDAAAEERHLERQRHGAAL